MVSLFMFLPASTTRILLHNIASPPVHHRTPRNAMNVARAARPQRPHLHFLDLPAELRLAVYGLVFAATPYDYAGTTKAELRVYDGHVMIRRHCPSPPPRWKGARDLMCTSSAIYHEVLAFLYPQMQFDIRIGGSANDRGPLRSRLNSEYPLGNIRLCPPLRYIKTVKILLDSWSPDEMARLRARLRSFLDAVRGSTFLDVRYIGFYFDDTSRWSSGMPMRSSDEIAIMLSELPAKAQVDVYDPNRTVSEHIMRELLRRINGRDCTHVGFTNNR